MNELGPDARRLLEAAKGDRPGADARDRMKKGVLAAVAIGTATAAGTASGGAAVAGGGVATWLKVTVGVALAAVLGTGALWLGRSGGEEAHTRRLPPTAAPVQASPAPPAPVAEALPEVSVEPGVPEPVRSVRRTAGPTDAAALEEETRLVGGALSALRSGRAPEALSLLEEHAHRFPRGALVQERAAARVVALCAAGRTEEGRTSQAEFLRRWPRSPSATRVREACPANP